MGGKEDFILSAIETVGELEKIGITRAEEWEFRLLEEYVKKLIGDGRTPIVAGVLYRIGRDGTQHSAVVQFQIPPKDYESARMAAGGARVFEKGGGAADEDRDLEIGSTFKLPPDKATELIKFMDRLTQPVTSEPQS